MIDKLTRTPTLEKLIGQTASKDEEGGGGRVWQGI